MKNCTPSTELACFSYGNGADDEGIALRLKIGPYQILLDCGLWDLSAIAPDLAEIDLVWCSHAHPDHARGLLQFHHQYPEKPVFASEITAYLLHLLRLPVANQPPDWGWVQALPLRSPIELRPGLVATLIPAGHLPGAAILHLAYTPSDRLADVFPYSTYTVVYTGDMALSGMRFVEGLPLEELRNLRPNVLILEGSYGTARLPRRRQLENQFVEQVLQALQSGRSVLLPVSEMGTGPELLILFRSHHRFTGQDIEIWVDEAIARGCDAYLDLLPQFPRNVQNFARYQSLFWDERIRPLVKRLPTPIDSSDETLLPSSPYPSIVVVSHHTRWERICEHSSMPWLVLLPNPIGKAQLAGRETLHTPFDHPQSIPVETYFLSEHCDVAGTLQVIHSLRPQHIVFVHGSTDYLSDLSALDELSNRYQLHIPSVGHWVELPVGEAFYQPAPPENRYQGELTLLPTAIHITLPTELTLDSRWSALATTGVLDIRWQGSDLVLKGISPQDLISRDRDSNWIRPDYDQRPICGTCRYYHGQHCRNLDSPMAGLKVSKDGYCPMYETQLGT